MTLDGRVYSMMVEHDQVVPMIVTITNGSEIYIIMRRLLLSI